MRKLLLTGLACAGLVLALPDVSYAHGGQYRGPGDVVPPGAGGGGGNTPGPSGPSTPGPGGPSTPGPAGPTTPGPAAPTTGGPATPGGGGGPTTPRGAQIEPDLTKWQFWWEFNKDPFLNLKEAIHAGVVQTGSDEFFMGAGEQAEARDTWKPSESDIMNTVLPQLKRMLDSTDNRDIVSSCLVAMAKIGKDNPDKQILILDEMRKHLPDLDQEIQETAALSMGISQLPEAIPNLVDLAKDTPKGRDLVKSPTGVNVRTRAFSCYGLGLIAYASSNPDVKRQCFDALKQVLEDTTKKGITDRNVPVAAVNGIRLVRPDPEGSDKDKQLLADCLDTLWTFYKRDLGEGDQLIQAHVPPAIGQLLGRGGDKDGKYLDTFVADLDRNRSNQIYQSCVIAIGLLAEPAEKNKDHAKYSAKLLDYYNTGKNPQARNFATIALAEIGGNTNRNELLKALAKGQKAIEKPWAAIALGVLAFNAAEEAGASAAADPLIGRALQKELNDNKNPETVAAMAVALGLAKYNEAESDLESLLIEQKQQSELAGYLCIGLALMDAQRAKDTIRELVKNSVRRPDLLKQAAIALGKLGDKKVTDLLQSMLTDGDPVVAKLSAIAQALGYIGDRRTIDPLIKLMNNEDITPLSRAFAVVALGGVADKEPLPWNSKIAVDMNYRAAVETLTNSATGVLDIL